MSIHILIILCGILSFFVSIVITSARLMRIVHEKYGEDCCKLQDGSGKWDDEKIQKYWEMYFNDEL